MPTFEQRLAALGFATYEAYLRSPQWIAFRDEYRKANPTACVVCGRAKTALHHVTYLRLGSERPTDVVPLCHGHHQAVHDWLKINGKTVRDTAEAVAALGGPSASRRRSAAEGRAFGLMMRDRARAKKSASKARRKARRAERKAAGHAPPPVKPPKPKIMVFDVSLLSPTKIVPAALPHLVKIAGMTVTRRQLKSLKRACHTNEVKGLVGLVGAIIGYQTTAPRPVNSSPGDR